ncbi:MAG: hypothetical protein U1E22_02140, partial [Coriobacteriia bacterium]|nr:hypothetical protein [Coriobacteriia bacterium]
SNAFRGAPFEYRVTLEDDFGSWVIGKADGEEAGVFLGRCDVAREGETLNSWIEKTVQPGTLLRGRDLEEAVCSIRQRGTGGQGQPTS